MNIFINNFQSISRTSINDLKYDDYNYSFSEIRLDNIITLLEGIVDGENIWTVDSNSGIREGDINILMCATTAFDNIRWVRNNYSSNFNADECVLLNDLCDKYKEYAGKLICVGIVKSIEESPERNRWATIDRIIGFDNPVPAAEFTSFISINKTGTMTKVQPNEYDKLCSIIHRYNPSVDLSEYGVVSKPKRVKTTNSQMNNHIFSVSGDDCRESELIDYNQRQIVDNLISQRCGKEKSEYISKPEKRIEVKAATSGRGIYPRDEYRKINALERADYKCEICPEHKSFISKRTGKPYMETHHLVPLEYWESFEYSLDVEANIVSLCSNCHNQIHYGRDSVQLIEKLYNDRLIELKDAGIIISKDQLLGMYNGTYIRSDSE